MLCDHTKKVQALVGNAVRVHQSPDRAYFGREQKKKRIDTSQQGGVKAAPQTSGAFFCDNLLKDLTNGFRPCLECASRFGVPFWDLGLNLRLDYV